MIRNPGVTRDTGRPFAAVVLGAITPLVESSAEYGFQGEEGGDVIVCVLLTLFLLLLKLRRSCRMVQRFACALFLLPLQQMLDGEYIRKGKAVHGGLNGGGGCRTVREG